MLKVNLVDPSNKKAVEIDSPAGEKQGIVVATRDLKSYTSGIRFFLNGVYGADMNQNAAFGGTPILLYNEDAGTPGEWDTSIVAGGPGAFDFQSTTQVQSGTYSIDATASLNNNTMQLDKGSVQSLGGYVAITGYIYITAWPATGTKEVEIYGWDTSTAAQVGVRVNMSSYIDTGLFGAWQRFVIPLDDLGLENETIYAIRVTTISLGAGVAPDYFLDMIQIQETGAPIIYTIEPEKGTWLHLRSIQTIMADDYTGLVAEDSTSQQVTMPCLPYDALLGVSALTNGLVYRRIQKDEVKLSSMTKQLSHLLQFPGSTITNAVSDGTNTCITINTPYAYPETLKSEDKDKITITIQDDLSGLLLLRSTVAAWIEQRT